MGLKVTFFFAVRENGNISACQSKGALWEWWLGMVVMVMGNRALADCFHAETQAQECQIFLKYRNIF